jgi:apolipoprotein N-acyltransferase
VVTGLLLIGAFPAPDLGALAFVALVPLLVVARTRRPLAAGGLGLVAGLVFFAVHIWWVTAIGDELIGGLLAWAALTLTQALVVAAFCALVPLAERLGAWRVPLLALTWAAFELVRSHMPLGGFAWGLLGLTQHGGGPLLPLARVVGVYGLSAVVVAVNLALAAAVAERARRRRALAWVAVAALLPLAGLAAPGLPAPDGEVRHLAVIQGNVPFDRTNRGRTDRAVFERHLQMTEALAGSTRPDLVVWPEGAADVDPLAHPERGAEIAQATSALRAPLLLGATTRLGSARFATEALLFTPDGRLADRYVKRRLVPFGEYIPGGELMRRLVPATRQLPYDKVPGHQLEPMLLDGDRFGVMICYESAYPEDTRQLVRDGAAFIVMLTNNASFGRSALGAQHVATSQLRAVESGRTVVHAAISGISAVVGPDGRASQVTGLYEAATILADVQPRTGLTVYARAGRLVEAAIVGAAVATLVALAWPRRRREELDEVEQSAPGRHPGGMNAPTTGQVTRSP